MELDLKQVRISYLQSVGYETILQEESGETIVPDSMPDMERIVDSFAAVIMRGKDCNDSGVSLTGDIQAGVLYAAQQEDMPRLLPVYLPFSVRRPAEAGSCMVECRVRSVDARMLNSRKLSVRVGLCITLRLWQPQEVTCYRPGKRERRIQLKCGEYPMKLPVECTEKNLLLRESLPLGAGQPQVSRILHTDARCEVTEEKLNGDKAVCKGSVQLRVLYETPEQALASCELALPFSQFLDLEREYEEQGLTLLPVLTALETAAEGDSIAVEAGVCMQCCVTQTLPVPLVEDAYATRGRLELEWCSYGMQPRLDSRVWHQELRQELPVQAAEILHATALPDTPQGTWSDGVYHVLVPIQLQVLYRDGEGQLQQAVKRAVLSVEAPSADASARLSVWQEGTLFAAPGGGGMELRLPVAIRCDWYGKSELRSICAGNQEDEKETEERPAVIIRSLTADGDLWDIAKELRTTVSAIQIANDMEEDVAPAGTMLLIPIVA